MTRGAPVVSFAPVRGLLSHVLVALSALALGYAATPWLQRWEVAPLAQPVVPEPEPAEPVSCAPWIEEVAALHARLAELQAVPEPADAPAPEPAEEPPPIEVAEPRPEETTGALDPPSALDERFTEAALLDTYRRAIADTGLDVEIASVDCTEYPCIVYGHTVDDQAVLEAFLSAPAFDLYADRTARSVFSWGGARLADADGTRRYFGVALYPESDRERRGTRIEQRLALRSAQMWEAVRGGVR